MNNNETKTTTSSDKPVIKHIVILGGGTAGWMAANLMADKWLTKGIKITLVESPDIGIVGVGEGSTPSLKMFFDSLGVSESEWMPECNATYKTGIRFDQWSTIPGFESYFHPFTTALDTETEPVFEYNTVLRRQGIDAEAHPDRFYLNTMLADKGLSPIAHENFPLKISYGYHFDAALVGKFLAKRAIKKGIHHISAEIQDVKLSENGDISQLITKTEDSISADFFLDCSGFRSLLIGKTLKVPHLSFKENLFNNCAVTIPTKISSEIPSETVSTALKNGWAWKIPLTNRFGNGYVFSDDFCTPDEAETELREKVGLLDSDVEARHLKMRVGRFARHWEKNCVAVGLSQGFIEPLEATALHFIQATVGEFMHNYEKGNFTNQYQDNFNQSIARNFERVRDFIVTHYKTNTRNDTEYWRANRNNENISESLNQVMQVWYSAGNLSQELRRQKIARYYQSTSWHVIFAGMGIYPLQQSLKPLSANVQNFDLTEIDTFLQRCVMNFDEHKSHLKI